MRIVILTPIPFWHPGTNELISRLADNNIEVVAYDIFNGLYIDEKNTKHDLIPNTAKGIFRKIYCKVFRKKIIKKVIKENDIIDMHYVDCFYHKYLNTLTYKNTKLISTFFGSDLYRQTHKNQQKWQKKILNKCNAIVIGPNMLNDFNSSFPGLENKIIFNQYGSSRLTQIQELNNHKNKSKFRSKYKIENDKIVLTIGYSANKHQQHLLILDCISQLPQKLKDKIFLLFPLTYARNSEYINKLNTKISELNIPNICFNNFLSDKELCETRIISDITINTQTTDALSSSIKEAFVVGNHIIVGDWLPYNIYEELGLLFNRTSKDMLYKNIEKAIANFDINKTFFNQNPEKIMNFASWDVLTPKWIELYKKVSNERN